MDTVRFGVVGLGNMGRFHADYMNSLQPAARLGGVCDVDEKRRKEISDKHGGVPAFGTYQELIDSGAVDAILIATPHYQHPEIAEMAMNKGLHVLCEKPAAVTVNGARRMNDAHARNPKVQFGMMFQMRTAPIYQKLKSLIAEGELGELARLTWIVTDWFRTWSYYGSGGWRATWKGEGGGVLINQCPHNLDLIPWLTGMMPTRVTGIAHIGKTHPIEVEDDVTAIMEYDNGMMGHFITTTGEAPGTNRLEIAGDRGKIVAENGKLKFSRTRKSVKEARETSPNSFEQVEAWEIDIPFKSEPEGHKVITENFVAAIREGKPLIAPGEDGVKQLELGNAMLMAGLSRQAVELPLNGVKYDAFIHELDKKYGGRKKIAAPASGAASDMAASFKSS
ncbi:MAG: Gfo/Idh/MocA family oxidoreductase [Betaproteobacteria bacterium]|nr:Gfo/Idh/MocA family oxidoreductase [Betaproteobacteria bacterium]